MQGGTRITDREQLAEYQRMVDEPDKYQVGSFIVLEPCVSEGELGEIEKANSEKEGGDGRLCPRVELNQKNVDAANLVGVLLGPKDRQRLWGPFWQVATDGMKKKEKKRLLGRVMRAVDNENIQQLTKPAEK